MQEKIEWGKHIINVVLTALASYFAPIHGNIVSLSVLLGINALVGLITDILVNGKSFNFKKAFRGIIEMCIFFMLIASLYVIGEQTDKKGETILVLTYITYTIIYYYMLNILRNLKAITDDMGADDAHKVMSFLYYVLSFQLVEKIKFLKEYEQSENDNGSRGREIE